MDGQMDECINRWIGNKKCCSTQGLAIELGVTPDGLEGKRKGGVSQHLHCGLTEAMIIGRKIQSLPKQGSGWKKENINMDSHSPPLSDLLGAFAINLAHLEARG